jgi:hypothetical protein
MRIAAAFCLFAALASAQPLEKPRVSRAAMQAAEKLSNQRILSIADAADASIDLIGLTRGLYLNNYGVVFTAEVNLVYTVITPFNPSMSPAQLQKIHEKKLIRIGLLKEAMRDILQQAAVSLDTVPANEQVVLGVNLVNQPWEDKSGMPAQILMRAERQKLLAFKSGRLKEDAQSVIRVGEF